MPRTKTTRSKKNLQPKLVAPKSNDVRSNIPTSKQQLSSVIKSARDIMRKDAGLNGDLDRLPQLSWILFLKSYDDLELSRETQAVMDGAAYKPVIPVDYRWRDWAADENKGLTGEQLLDFGNNDLLRKLRSLDDSEEQRVIAQLFAETYNRTLSGFLLRDIVNLVGRINFNSSDDIHTLSHLYESMHKEMRDAAGDSGEFYTPRPVVRFMVERVAPRLGERVLDPACGTGGFLVEAYNYLAAQQKADRFEVIVTNPPFGGEAEKGIQENFPGATRASETAILFM